jgi:hypothetical protein
MSIRPYTGNKDGVSKGKREGLEHLVACIGYLSGNKLWNNGTRVVRPMRGKTAISVHATGRAADISYRKMPNGKGSSRAYAVEWIDLLVKHADELGLELLTDYSYTKGLGGGRTWKCDRDGWLDNKRGVISGGGSPSSDWFHIELAPCVSDSVPVVQEAINRIVRELQAKPLPNA